MTKNVLQSKNFLYFLDQLLSKFFSFLRRSDNAIEIHGPPSGPIIFSFTRNILVIMPTKNAKSQNVVAKNYVMLRLFFRLSYLPQVKPLGSHPFPKIHRGDQFDTSPLISRLRPQLFVDNNFKFYSEFFSFIWRVQTKVVYLFFFFCFLG